MNDLLKILLIRIIFYKKVLFQIYVLKKITRFFLILCPAFLIII